jgi:hypothetical protein
VLKRVLQKLLKADAASVGCNLFILIWMLAAWQESTMRCLLPSELAADAVGLKLSASKCELGRIAAQQAHASGAFPKNFTKRPSGNFELLGGPTRAEGVLQQMHAFSGRQGL